ncbi:hypothetical protein V500_05654 [Pseudogymnoascus sp. VKM F-4518 (FW-2643)]|nr:hypothetical protein V500_05654 [Pseudogymnoascus sp. VKM F-4518 (FW-2643)]
MARAERFILDLSDEEDSSPPPTTTHPSPTTNKPSNPSTNPPAFQTTPTPPSFIRDIIERAPSAPKPPTAPIYKQTPTGFPIHKKRTRVSAFKAARGGGSIPVGGRDGGVAVSERGVGGVAGSGVGDGVDKDEEERRQIDLENQRKMAAMSPEEIEQERKELLAALDPAVVKMLMSRGAKKTAAPVPVVSDAEMVHRMKADLGDGGKGKDGGKEGGGDKKREIGLEDYLKRANIDDGRGDTWVEEVPTPNPAAAAAAETAMETADNKEEKEKATRISKPTGRRVEPTKAVHWLENDEAEPKELPDLQPASEFKPRSHTHSSTASSTSQPTDSDQPAEPQPKDSTDTIDSLHFPRPPTLPDLDPSSPNFLQDLHSAYFPSLPTTPSSLAWLAPLPTPGSPADLESSYSPSQTSIPASSLRFDFKGHPAAEGGGGAGAGTDIV